MQKCPKCQQPYQAKGKRQKSKHHIIPRRLWGRTATLVERQILDDYTVDICRGCHDSLNRLLDAAERAVLLENYQEMYRKVLTVFLQGATCYDSSEQRRAS